MTPAHADDSHAHAQNVYINPAFSDENAKRSLSGRIFLSANRNSAETMRYWRILMNEGNAYPRMSDARDAAVLLHDALLLRRGLTDGVVYMDAFEAPFMCTYYDPDTNMWVAHRDRLVYVLALVEDEGADSPTEVLRKISAAMVDLEPTKQAMAERMECVELTEEECTTIRNRCVGKKLYLSPRAAAQAGCSHR
jgi:hypothetical protein